MKRGNLNSLKNAEIKLADFGISKILQDFNDVTQTTVGSPNTMGNIHFFNFCKAPEVNEGKEYGLKADMFSFGCVLFEMCNSCLPYETSNLSYSSVNYKKEIIFKNQNIRSDL